MLSVTSWIYWRNRLRPCNFPLSPGIADWWLASHTISERGDAGSCGFGQMKFDGLSGRIGAGAAPSMQNFGASVVPSN